MKIEYVVYYKDGRKKMLEFEKPSGALPMSTVALWEGFKIAENDGEVERMGTSKVNPFSKPTLPLVIDEDLVTREDILSAAKKYGMK